jgi:peroxiredoxin
MRWKASGTLALLVCGLVFASEVLGQVPYSVKPTVQVGTQAFDFTLLDQYGAPVRLTDYRYRNEVWLVFYRGEWDKADRDHLQRIQSRLKTIRRLGAIVLAVSTDSRSSSQRLAKRRGLKIRLLADPKARIARLYGLLHPRGHPYRKTDVAWPADILIDRWGKVALVALAPSARERPHPDDLLDALRRLVAERNERLRRLKKGIR